ncbi:hypothetical protein [Streptomyces panaciradicis]|uniref:hypothetical protein n=1 Tax=Streptomyces panaciradicis TaxID=1470261 RepID=UPI00201CC0CB|nr:hypothetical protein [Streptomyces panaciradicis]MCL6672719.1 hypothetical protein [Streptomyces panaciradicis]
MAFQVRPDDLDGYSRQVGRAADDAHQAQEYLKRHGGMGALDGQGLFLYAIGLHAQAMEGAKEVLTRLHTLLSASAEELAKSAAYYRTTDRAQASGLDATYPPSKR